MEHKRKKGRSVLVLGGGSGIGFKSTEYLATKTNCKVVVMSLDLSPECHELANAYPRRIRFLQGDVTRNEDVQRAVDIAGETGGGIDSLVYCAGLLYVQRCDALDLDMVRKSFEVNVFGAISACQLALPYLRSTSTKRARIIILSSGADHRIINCGWMPYSSSKAALSRFLQCLAHEEESSRVKVQGVYPRVTRTPITKDMIAGNYKNIMRDEEIQKFLDWDREGSMIEPPEWCGNAVGLLAADEVDGTPHGTLAYYDEQVFEQDYKGKALSARL